jgi:choline dehydrogenase-like flavoprotein
LNFEFIYLLLVGAGSAGSIIANRLSEDEDVNVLLIEAGGSELSNDNIRVPLYAASLQMSNEDWAYYTVPQKHSQWAMNEQVLIINYNRSLLRVSENYYRHNLHLHISTLVMNTKIYN